ncbi:hypothetical protein ACEWET_01985 [Paraliobacillus sp. JSM ZJ581]
MLVCQDRSCGGKKHITRKTNVRCPNCNKKMGMRGQEEVQTFTCSCGDCEKLVAFQNRKQKRTTDKASKRDTNKYYEKTGRYMKQPCTSKSNG